MPDYKISKEFLNTYYIAGFKKNEHTYLYSITVTTQITQMPIVKLDVIVQNRLVLFIPKIHS
jgi:hypothetical protein